jgi:anti-sigma factor RsiW
MRCEEMRELLDLYLDGELPEETARKVDRHLLRCPACAYEARALEQTRTMLREAVAPTVTSPGFRERTLARLLDALEEHLRPAPGAEDARQWTLPFLREDEKQA